MARERELSVVALKTHLKKVMQEMEEVRSHSVVCARLNNFTQMEDDLASARAGKALNVKRKKIAADYLLSSEEESSAAEKPKSFGSNIPRHRSLLTGRNAVEQRRGSEVARHKEPMVIRGRGKSVSTEDNCRARSRSVHVCCSGSNICSRAAANARTRSQSPAPGRG